MGEERRQFKRINEAITVSYRRLTDCYISSSSTNDISAGGISLPTLQRFKTGIILDLKIRLTEASEPIEAIGEVMWVKEIENSKYPFVIGVRFIKMEAPGRFKIINYVKTYKPNASENIDWIN